MREADIPQINIPFSFTRRPRPIPPDLRPDWRVTVLVLILDYSRGKKASLKKVNVINWAIRSPENREILHGYFIEKKPLHDIVIRIEPGISRAIDFAKGHGLVVMEYGNSTGIRLTPKGKQFANKIETLHDCFTTEKDFLRSIKPYINEKDVNVLLNGGI
ncbi:hypothetical protein [Methanococcoides sp. AM1]|uniref:hypothetical protein n=1 Tax=Methanococcoides sp. AM1 TaxID=1201011 RepID=UPI0010838B32|nr:hypothetical protein [Methanococcoides sp. AM1]